MKRALYLTILVPAVISLAACSVSANPGGNPKPTAGASGPITIGFSNATQQSPFYVSLGDAVKAEAQTEGATVDYVDANGDITKQNNDIQDLITKSVSVLIINPVDPKGIAPSLAAAKAANIPVITVDRPAKGAVAFVGRDNVAMGKLVGEAVKAKLGAAGGKIVEIQGDAGGAVAAARKEGFHDAFQGDPSVTFVEGPYANYIRSQAVTAMQDLLQANPDVKVVYAHNDDMALGALQVLKENGRTDVLVAGVDGLMEAVKAISEGNQYVATAVNDPSAEGALAAKTAIQIVKGTKVSSSIDAGTALISKDNASTYVGSTLFAVAK